jgi:hypothetical protein
MTERQIKFKYRLETLIRLRSAERDALKTEVERALSEVQMKTSERESITRSIRLAEEELRSRCCSGVELDLENQRRVQLYLRQQWEKQRTKQLEVQEAARAASSLVSQLDLKLKDAKALENHRERKRRQFDGERLRVAMNAADEQWAHRRRG